MPPCKRRLLHQAPDRQPLMYGLLRQPAWLAGPMAAGALSVCTHVLTSPSCCGITPEVFAFLASDVVAAFVSAWVLGSLRSGCACVGGRQAGVWCARVCADTSILRDDPLSRGTRCVGGGVPAQRGVVVACIDRRRQHVGFQRPACPGTSQGWRREARAPSTESGHMVRPLSGLRPDEGGVRENL